MRVLVSKRNHVPIKSSRPVESHDGERIHEEILQWMLQQQNIPFYNDASSADLFASINKEDCELLRKFIAEMDLHLPDRCIPSYIDPALDDPINSPLDAGYFQVPNTVRQPQMNFNRLTDGVPNKVARPSEELQLLSIQAQHQRLQILEWQKQLHYLTQRQNYAHAVQESAVKEVESTPRMQSEMEIVATNSLPPDYVRICRLNSHGSETMQAHTRSCNQKRMTTRSNDKVVLDAEQTHQLEKLLIHPRQSNRMDKSESSLRMKNQARSNRRGGRGNVAAETGPVVREKSKTFSCAECGKGFNEKLKLTNHLRVHSGEKPFKCRECGAAFSQSGSLTRHQRIHSGVKPFKCLICNVAFRQKSSLSRHLLIHTNEKPFACDICNELFRQKSHLSDHMNIHSGRRPHKCNVCKKSFRQRSALYRHRKVHD